LQSFDLSRHPIAVFQDHYIVVVLGKTCGGARQNQKENYGPNKAANH
jgi:hypothetical protein